MKLRTRLDVFSAALLSALGASQLAACGGSALESAGTAGTGAGGSGGTGASAGTASAGTSSGGVSNGGTASAGASNGGTASAGDGGFGAAGSAGMGNRFPCKNPVVVGNGVISCDGFMERQKVETCASKLPRPEPYPNAPAGAQCKSDADCTAMPNGWCGGTSNLGGFLGPYCNYGCIQDSDCGPGTVCLCGDPVGECVGATCNSDSDCASGFLCKTFDQSGGCNRTMLTCQSPTDECGSDADCAGSLSGNRCWSDGMTHFVCGGAGCTIGRPFLVEGSERLAPALRSSDWRGLTPPGLRVAELGGALPARLAREWTRVALMEHASIAAFARFALQLLSLGAPPELIERATAAMADETKHAKACFALASSYAGEPVGPGPLSVERSLDEMSLVEIVLTTVREGCVGETVAAIEAREASEHATDPQVRELLRTISEDETRHAELAFSFVKWALGGGDAALHAAVREEFEALSWETESRPAGLDAVECELLQNGVIPGPLRQAIRAGAIADVILPCALALFAPDSVAAARDSYRVAS